MSIEVRGVLFALLMGLPGLAAAAQRLIEREFRPGWQAALATIVALVAFSNVTFVYATFAAEKFFEKSGQQTARLNADTESRYCFTRSSVAELASLPFGRVVALPDQGPAVLAYSNDTVLAGPYHRDERGILDTFDFFTQGPDRSAMIVRERSIDYVVICRTNYDYAYYLDAAKQDGLIGRIAAGHTPTWLLPVRSTRSDDRVMIYRVLHNQLP